MFCIHNQIGIHSGTNKYHSPTGKNSKGYARVLGVLGQKLTVIIFLGCLLSCSPYVVQKATVVTVPMFSSGQAIMKDGYSLPLMQLSTEVAEPKAIVLALHGMNDYSNAFRTLGEYLELKNIKLIAYDQRGFGETKGRGYWHGIHSLTADLITVCQLIKNDHPQIPLFLLGDSMGGAVVLAALESLEEKVEYEGIVLIAPAVWAKEPCLGINGTLYGYLPIPCLGWLYPLMVWILHHQIILKCCAPWEEILW